MSEARAVDEIEGGERFGFGENWKEFLRGLDEKTIIGAEDALKKLFRTDSLDGRTFLDVGSGSGLSSLAARRLGAQVTSFDFDPSSVECTKMLRKSYLPEDELWKVMQGSAADAEFLDSLGTFDIVYSWGVLHHTGQMDHCLSLMPARVKPGGNLMIAIYNDQGIASKYWAFVKRTYNEYAFMRPIWLAIHTIWPLAPSWFLRKVQKRPLPRGMRFWTDFKDWIGGYPFETATPAQIVDTYQAEEFLLSYIKTVRNRMGCNEFVFEKRS